MHQALIAGQSVVPSIQFVYSELVPRQISIKTVFLLFCSISSGTCYERCFEGVDSNNSSKITAKPLLSDFNDGRRSSVYHEVQGHRSLHRGLLRGTYQHEKDRSTDST